MGYVIFNDKLNKYRGSGYLAVLSIPLHGLVLFMLYIFVHSSEFVEMLFSLYLYHLRAFVDIFGLQDETIPYLLLLNVLVYIALLVGVFVKRHRISGEMD